jgi:hypothetical protein
MKNTAIALLLAWTPLGCGASTELVVQSAPDATIDARVEDVSMMDSPPDASVDVPSLDEPSLDVPLFEDGAECRHESVGQGWTDCRLFFQARGLMVIPFTDNFICCAGRCFLGLSCRVDDPTQAICDLSERPCTLDEVCCARIGRRYSCEPRFTGRCNRW